MRRVFAGLVLAAACACAPAPARVPAADAGELLARFAAGARAPGLDVCTPEGRSLLRGAVRAYGAELLANGVVWPAPAARGAHLPGSSVDASVLVAVAAGFVEASDLQGPVRGLVHHLALADWPEIERLREGASIACEDAAELQQAAARLVVELARLETLAEGADTARASERLARQQARVERARRQMRQISAFVEAEIEAARARRG